MRLSNRRERIGLATIVGAYLVLGATYSLIVPVFEAPDEPMHLYYAYFVAEHRRLPNQLTNPPEAPGEGHQPPLYYLLLSPLSRLMPLPAQLLQDIAQLDWATWQLPPSQVRDWYEARPRLLHLAPPAGEGASRGAAHFRLDPEQEYALGGWRLTVHVLRLVSLLLGVMVVCGTYLMARQVGAGPAYAALGTALVAFLPQFLFISGTISNDNLANALAAVVLVLWANYWRSALNAPRAILIGGLCGLALLAKMTTSFLLPLGAVAALMLGRPWWRGLLLAALLLLSAGAVVSPWLLRNLLLYGDPLAIQMQIHTLGGPGRPLPTHSLLSPYFLCYLPKTLLLSFRGVFGHMDLPGTLRGALVFYAVLTASVGAVLLRLAGRDREDFPGQRRLVAWLILGLALAIGLIIHYNLTFPQAQGRYLFPTLPAVGTLGALGVERLTRRRHRLGRWIPPLVSVLLLTLAINELVAVIWPAYWAG